MTATDCKRFVLIITVEQEFGGMSPAIAVLGPLMRQRENVVGSLANGAQDRPARGR
jgi:hypothetical protein